MNKRNILISLAVIIVGLVIGLGGWFVYQQNHTKTFTGDGAAFEYTYTFQRVNATKAKDKHTQTLIRLVDTTPLSVIDFKQEKGAGIGAKVSKINILDYLENSAEKALPQAFSSFKKHELKRIKAAHLDASRIDFTYLGKDKKTKLFASLIIIPKENDAYYAYVQSVNEGRWRSDVDRLQSSFRLN